MRRSAQGSGEVRSGSAPRKARRFGRGWPLLSSLGLGAAIGCAAQEDPGDVPNGTSGSGNNTSGSSAGGSSSGSGGGSSSGSSSGGKAGMSGGGAPGAGTGGSDEGGKAGMSMGGDGGSGGKAGAGGSAGSGGKAGSGGTAGSAGSGGGAPVDVCKNNKADGDETDVDCGGKVCTARCATDKGCDNVGDCVQTAGNYHVCDADKCEPNGCATGQCAFGLTRYVINSGLPKGQAFVTWDSDSLDIEIQMIDATPVNDSDLNWEDDSVEIYLDLNHSNATPYDGDDFQITVPRAAGALSGLGAYTAASIVVDRTTDAMGYTLKISIPWGALNGATSQLGKTIGFDIGVNDDNANGTRDAQIMLFGDANNYQNTVNFGDLVLTP